MQNTGFSHLRGEAQHLLHQLLGLSRLFQEQFDDCRQQLQLHLKDTACVKSAHMGNVHLNYV